MRLDQRPATVQAGACNALEYLCCTAPILLPTLPSPSLKGILATSKGLRSQVHKFVTQLHLQGSHSDAKLLLSRDWPSLHELSLDCPPHDWQGGKRVGQRSNKALLLLLGQGKWPLLRLKVSGMSLDSIHKILLLQQGQWSELETLHLSFCSLTEHSIAQLAAGPWHHLRHLNLLGSKLKAADLQQLSNADWPELRSVKLESIDYETMLPPSAQQQADLLIINVAAWPKLTSLVAHNFGNHTLNMIWLTCSCFPKLQILDASGARICSDNLQMIIEGEWPELLTLKLRHIGASSEGMFYLHPSLGACWSKLKCLDLSDRSSCEFDDEVCTQLAQANWPVLERLSLRGQPFSTEGAAELIKADWPLLKFLDVCSCCVGAAEVGVLMSANWPLLEHLEVQDNKAIAALLASVYYWSEFELVVNEIAEFDDDGDEYDIEDVCWPNLKVVVLAASWGPCTSSTYSFANLV